MNISGEVKENPLGVVTGLATALRWVEGGRKEAVHEARRPRFTWEEIGAALGVSRRLETLPPGQHIATVMFYIQGLSQREIAAALGLGVGAVKSRLHKGRVARCDG